MRIIEKGCDPSIKLAKFKFNCDECDKSIPNPLPQNLNPHRWSPSHTPPAASWAPSWAWPSCAGHTRSLPPNSMTPQEVPTRVATLFK